MPIDMKLSDEEKRDFSTPRPPQAPKFPHGLRIHLEPEQLEKLGFKSAPEVDDEMFAEAVVKVVNVAKRDEKEDSGDLDFSVALQITNLRLKGTEKKDESPSQVIYGG